MHERLAQVLQFAIVNYYVTLTPTSPETEVDQAPQDTLESHRTVPKPTYKLAGDNID